MRFEQCCGRFAARLGRGVLVGGDLGERGGGGVRGRGGLQLGADGGEGEVGGFGLLEGGGLGGRGELGDGSAVDVGEVGEGEGGVGQVMKQSFMTGTGDRGPGT